MSDGTVRGTFDLNADPALNKLRSLRTEGGRADDQMVQLGTTMDRIGGADATKRLDTYANRLGKVADTAESTTARVSTSWDAQRRSIDDQSTRIEGRVDTLQNRIERYGRTRATATVEVNGFDKANAQIMELERRLDKLSRQRSTPTIGVGGGFSGGGATTAAGGGSSAGGGGIGLAGKLAIGGAALLPGVQALGVSATALAGSATGAALGAGTIYGGAASTLGTGAGLTYGVAKPAIKELGELQKEQTKYTEAVRKYGQASKQAAVARRELAAAESKAGPGSGTAIRQVSLTREAYLRATAPGRASVYSAVGNVAVAGRALAPTVSRAANTATAASASAVTNYAGFLAGGQTQRTVMGLAQEYSRDLPMVERSLENITSTVEHLALAARPFFHEAADWVETWTHGLSSNTSNEQRVQQTMRGLVSETKDWGKLAGATYRTIRDIFEMGRPSGDSMVVGLTETLDRWDSWIQRNPAKVSQFFKEAQTTTEKIAGALTSIVHLLSQAATSLSPIFNRGMDLVKVVSSLGPAGTTAGSALLYGAVRGGRGASSTAGGGVARSIVTTGVLGRPMTLSGGSRAAGGTVVGSAAATRYLSTAGGPTGRAAVGAAGQLPLFVTTGSGRTVANTARSVESAGVATPEAFAERYGSIEGAHYAMPASTLSTAESGGLASRAGGVLGGAAKTLGATVAIMAAIEAAGKGGSGKEIAQNFGSSTTFGLIHPVSNTGSKGQARASTFLGGIPSTLTPMEQQGVLARKLARLVGTSYTDNTGGLQHGSASVLGVPLLDQTSFKYSGKSVNPNSPNFLSQIGSQLKVLEGTPGDHTKNQVQEIKALRVAYQEASAEAKAYKKSRDEALNLQSEQHATNLSAQLGSAFGVERKGGRSTTGAFGDVTQGALTSMRSMREAGAKVLGENTLAWAHQLEKGNPELEGPVNELTASIKKRFHDLGQNVQIVNGHILTGSAEQWQAISTAMSEPVEKARERMSKSFTAIQREAVGALTAMGFSPKAAAGFISAQEKGGPSLGQVASGITSAVGKTAGAITGHARGGMIGGSGLLDTVDVPGGRAAPGEAWIANRHTMDDLSRATVEKFGKTAWQMIQGETRTHASARHATGGRIVTASEFGGPSDPGSSGRTASGKTNSAGLVGWAELSNPPGSLNFSALGHLPMGTMLPITYNNRTITAPKVDVGAGGPGLGGHLRALDLTYGLAQRFGWGPSDLHNVIVGDPEGISLGGSATAASKRVKLKARKTGVGGVPGLVADTAIGAYAQALSQHINSRLPTSSNSTAGTGPMIGGKSGPAGLGTFGGLQVDDWIIPELNYARSHGWSGNITSGYRGGFDPHAPGGSEHALVQYPGGAVDFGGMVDPAGRANREAFEAATRGYTGKRLIRATGFRDDGHMSGTGHQRGGRTTTWAGWHAKGGEYETRGPTIFGAGEGGKRERVSITPISHNSTGAKGHHIEVNIAHVSLASDSDIEKVAREVAGKILDELDAVGDGVPDRELIGR